ncbi:MAG: hypothetical protein OEV93_04265 [Candidatus Moranbacteria bacterium]|nr:hypothetical protein [Candidatus Moranbacteria bacterium]
MKFKYDIAVAIIESEVFNIQKQLESLIDLAEMVAKKAMGSSEQQDKIRNVISCLRQACAYNASSISNEKELIEARDAIAKNRTKIYQIFWKSVNKL